MNEPRITKHAIQRAKERRGWSEQTASGQIKAIMMRGERLAPAISARHRNVTEVIVDRTQQVALVFAPKDNAVVTLLTPDTLRATTTRDDVREMHEFYLDKVTEEYASAVDTLTDRVANLEYEREQLLRVMLPLQSKLMAYQARLNAIDVTLDEYRGDVERLESKQNRIHRGLAAAMLAK